jgi:hypothetical protein
MTIYIILFLFPLAMAFARSNINNFESRLLFYSFAIFLTLFVGLRYEVGVDWDNYLIQLDNGDEVRFGISPGGISLGGKDPGYAILNWIAIQLGYGIWFVNLISSFIFFVYLFKFAKKLPNPWFVLTVSMPYLVIVFSMNYTRQSIGFAFLLAALIVLEKEKIKHFIFYILIAALFHKSALVLIALPLFLKNRNRLFTILSVLVVATLGFFAIWAESYDALFNQYIVEEMSSSGANIRVMLCAIPAIIFIIMRNKLEILDIRKKIIFIFSLVSLCFLTLVLFTPYSTAIDRLALYLIPIQLYVYSYIPKLFFSPAGKYISLIIISVVYFSLLVVWLLNSEYAEYWIPYQFYPFVKIY